jgi:hypothetical protein
MQHAVKRKNKQRTHITKLVHDLLPTNQRVHRHNPPAQRCPSCASCLQEDRDHIMRCSAPPRESWRAETILELERRCQQLHTEPGLTKLLLYGISKWFRGQDVISFDEFSPKYHRVISQQNEIGWRQIFNGQMGIEWARIQDDHVYLVNSRRSETTRPGPNSASPQARFQRTGTQWLGEIIVTLWEQWLQVWAIRNAVIHGHNEESRAKSQKIKDLHRLHSIYQTRHLLEPSAQELLFDTIDDHQQQRSWKTIHNWLSIHETTFIQSVKQASKRAIQGVRSIKTYFPVRTATHSPTMQLVRHESRPSSDQLPTHTRRPRNDILSYFSTGRPPENINEPYHQTAVTSVPDNGTSSPAYPRG